MLGSESGDKETIQVTSSCWLSKRKINNINKKQDNSNEGNAITIPNFNICLTSIALPIIKLKNDLDRISENKQINRLREKSIMQKKRIRDVNYPKKDETKQNEYVTNDDEICSMLLRSKAFNETWKLVNTYMNCFIYNYVNEMIDKQINFLNKNLCLLDDKLSLLIVRTQTCPFLHLMQYRLITQKVKLLNNITSGTCKENNEDYSHTFTRKTLDNRRVTYMLLQKKREIGSCIINVHTQDNVENIIMRIIKRMNRKYFMKIDKNNINELFQKIVKKKRGVLIIFLKNYIKLKTSVFSALLLYLLHLKEINSINISVIITSNCILSALTNLDYFVKQNVHVNICNLYVNYYNLIENIIFNPLFNNVLFKLKEYYSIVDQLFYLNHDISFLKIKYFFYMFLRDFYDKKILSFLNVPLTYFCEIRYEGKIQDQQCPEGGTKYTMPFTTFKKELLDCLNLINVHDIRNKFILLLYGSNFYDSHIDHLKSKGKHHTIYHISDFPMGGRCVRGKSTERGKNIPVQVIDTKTNKERNTSLSHEQSKTKYGNRNNEEINPQLDGKNAIQQVDMMKRKNERPRNNEQNDQIKVNIHSEEKEKISKKRKRKNEFFYNCIRYLNFAKNEEKKMCFMEEENYTSSNLIGSGEENDTCVQNYQDTCVDHENCKSDLPNDVMRETFMHELIHLMQKDTIRKRLKSSENFRNFYFQNYTLHNLTEGLSPMNRTMNRNFTEDCNCLKQYIINYLIDHIKLEHNFDTLKVLRNEWKNNEFVKIYKYENMLSKMEKIIINSKVEKKNKKKESTAKCGNTDKISGRNSGRIMKNEEREGEEKKKKKHQKIAMLYLHKCLVKSISKRMITLLFKKKKYNICLLIINMILKSIPAYSSLRKRMQILKEFFKKYEQKFFVYNVKDLIKANDEIEKEFKEMINAICDILINLYMNKINVLKKILNDISTFLKSITYILKFEKYLNEKEFYALNFSTFVHKLNILIRLFDLFNNLKKKKCNDAIHAQEHRNCNENLVHKNVSNKDRDSSNMTTNSCSRSITHDGKFSKMLTPLWCNKVHGKEHIDQSLEMNKANEVINTLHCSGTSTVEPNENKMNNTYVITDIGENDNSSNFIQNKVKNNEMVNLFRRMDDTDIDLTLIEFILIFFCEFFYFLLMPCIYLLPLINTCIAHDHSADACDVLNKNLQIKLLHVLYYNKLELKDLYSLPHTFASSKVRPHNEIPKNKGIQEKSEDFVDKTELDIHLSKKKTITSFESAYELHNICQMEDMVIIFHIIQRFNAKYINICSMFIEYIHAKLNLSHQGGGRKGDAASPNRDRENRNRERERKSERERERENRQPDGMALYEWSNLDCESFQGLFYNFIIAIMSLYNYLRIIHIPSSFLRGKGEVELSTSINYNEKSVSDDEENHVISTNENGNIQNLQHDSKKLTVLCTPGGRRHDVLEKEAQLLNHKEVVISSHAYVNQNMDQKYKNYILDILGNINIRKIIFGRSYIT
ncbi:hypothetical protein, conserved [Plasmodium gonderi]|uniref:Uncharacterized protein n=1 Tax=Plasmodium gonderi TaxID=77519 RepID=A0A1Y1JFS1_PLAGO|nr:hypothetical protein, conserved [Plasmodium gonderi]GAW80185.1 hypothetical protein, conserved [Plasmodium gonderi]